MKNLFQSSKLKVTLVLVLIVVIFGSFLVGTILKQEQKLPYKGWSRAIDLKTTMAESQFPFVVNQNGEYHIYTKGTSTVNEQVLDSNYKSIKASSLQVKVPKFSDFWSDGEAVVYVDNHQLIYNVNGNKKVMDTGVEGMTVSSNQVAYWKSTKVYAWNPTTQKKQFLASSPFSIDTVTGQSTSDDLLVTSQTVKSQYVYIGVITKDQGYAYHSLDRFDKPYNATLMGFNFLAHQEKLYVVHQQYGSTTGGMYRSNFLDSYNLNSYKKTAREESLTIKDSETNLSFTNPQDVRIFWKDDQPVLLFEENSTLFRGEDAQNIFLAERHGEHWVAHPISSTAEPSSKPVLLASDTVIWNDLYRDKNTLMLGSQNASVIQKSYRLTQKDWGQATSRALMNLTVSILIVGYALMWVIPTGLFLMVMYFGFMTKIERNPFWIKGVGIALFLVTQLLFIKSLFGVKFYQFSPHILQFPGNFIILPILLMSLSLGLTEWVKNEEWGSGMYIFFCLILDVLMLGFLIGPYTL